LILWTFEGSKSGMLLRLSAQVVLTLKRQRFTSRTAVGGLAPDGGFVFFSLGYAVKPRETHKTLGPLWDPVQILVFFADPQGS
jgi:hypothetical protein